MQRNLFILRTDADETLLVEALRTGDAHAYKSLYLHYSGRVIRLSTMLLHESMVDDAVQDTFLRVFRNIDRFRGESRLGTWIHRIAVNVCLNAVRRQGARFRAETRLATDAQDADETFESSTIDRIAGATLEVLLQQLDPIKRATFWLFHVEQLTAAEIAEILDEPRPNVLKRLQRTRAELLRAWQAHEADTPLAPGKVP